MTIQDKIKNNKDYIRGRFSDPDTVKAAVGASFLLSVTLLFFGPSYLYYTNLLQIPYYYTDLVWLFVAYSLAAGAILAIVLILLKGTVHQRAVAIVFALGLLFWIQGHILVWDYGVLDGRAIIWEDYLINGIIDSVIWIALLALALFKGPSFYKHIALASVLLLVIQGGGLVAEVYQAPDEPEWKSYAIGYDDEAMFEFSSEQNVIILVLDMFQSDLFQEIIDEDPEYREMFDGFTFYRNAVGGHPTTYPSVTYILTGKHYDNSIPIQEHIKNSFLENSIPKAIKESGYRVDLYPLFGPEIYLGEEIASSVGIKQQSEVDRVVDGQKGASELRELTLFRYLPHIFKRYFHTIPFVDLGNGDDLHRDVIFYNTLVSDTSVSDNNKVFKFYHIWGAHAPYTLNSQLHKEDLPQNRSGAKEQAKAALKISGGLIDQLRKHDIYDNSMIFIIADHGNPGGSIGLNYQPLSGVDSINEYLVDKRVITSGIPLMLVKPFDSDGELIISDAPVTLGDIPQTIASELQLSYEFPGQSILSISEPEERERWYYYYFWSKEYFDLSREYLPPMTQYTITGHSWLPSSWKPTYRVYTPGEVIQYQDYTIPYFMILNRFSIQSGVGYRDYDSSINETVFISSRLTNQSGYLIYGPYISLHSGDYTIKYEIKAENVTQPDEPIFTVDIHSAYTDENPPTFMTDKMRSIYVNEIIEGEYTTIQLNLLIDTYNPNRLIEFRVFQPLNSDLYVKNIDIIKNE
ncbi:sulfatase-like hydrolase/transferase [Methanocalculus natronophilus]|uniref:sulfatase-like hydrolase/transferase n=1 Tax=Methanocalculus natronophilus TaxID=1262400 RepID=UPI0031B5700B